MYRQMTKPSSGGSKIEECPSLGSNEIAHECREVHPHEADERAEVEQLGPELIAHREGAHQSASAPTSRMLFRGICVRGSSALKKRLGMALSRPMP